MASYYEIVEGVELPAKLGGHPVLDFCNTLTGWDGEAPHDYLGSYEHLAIWAGYAELLPAERVESLRRQATRRSTAAVAALERARTFRAQLYAVLHGQPRPPGLAAVAADIEASARRRRLRQSGGMIGWEIDPGAGLGTPVDAVAWSAGQLLTSAELALVRACPGHGCGWLFLDRRGRRRWCTMATCGNRAKVKRFADRHH